MSCLLTIRSLAGAAALTLLLWAAAPTPPAEAHEAPMRATGGHGLMVGERWVMRHWAPFDEREAERALGLAPGQLIAFLYNDHHTIAQLARSRGVKFESLVQRLSAWTASLPAADRPVIRQRIRLALVSGHMPQHVFDHVFHGLAFTSELLVGTEMTHAEFSEQRRAGRSYDAMIRAAGNDPAATKALVHAGIDANAAAGVRTGQTPRSQARRMAARQHRRVDCWFARPPQLVDPAAPYGRRYNLHIHGHTAADVPTTRAAQRIEDDRIRRNLLRRPASCWELPQVFRGDPGAPLTRRELRRLARIPAGYRGIAANDHAGPGSSEPGHAGHGDHAGH